jgi:hypothetical protein
VPDRTPPIRSLRGFQQVAFKGFQCRARGTLLGRRH